MYNYIEIYWTYVFKIVLQTWHIGLSNFIVFLLQQNHLHHLVSVLYVFLISLLIIILWVVLTYLIILILLWPSRWTLVWVLDNLKYHNFPPQLVGAHGQSGVRAWRLVARVSAWDHVNAWLGLTAGDPVPRQENARFKIAHVSIKTESIGKLSNFNFQWTKTLYQNNLKHIAFFFTFFKDYRCN